MRQYLTPFFIACGILALCIVAYLFGVERGYSSGYAKGSSLPVKSDTCWVVDTHFVDRPVEVWREREKPVYYAVHDTQIVHTTDSVFVALQREKRGYHGEEYDAVVSGVDPVLESIAVYPRTAYITNTVISKRRWSLGVTAGPGILYDGSIHGGVGIVAGLTYNFNF